MLQMYIHIYFWSSTFKCSDVELLRILHTRKISLNRDRPTKESERKRMYVTFAKKATRKYFLIRSLQVPCTEDVAMQVCRNLFEPESAYRQVSKTARVVGNI